MIEELIEELKELSKAKDLLELVYLEHGPYQDKKISWDTWMQVRNFFNFDDGE